MNLIEEYNNRYSFFREITGEAMLDVQLDQTYRMDLVIDEDVIVELKAVSHVETIHRKQLWNYLNLTHKPYGMLINFGADHLYSEWYHRHPEDGSIEKIRLM